MARRSRRDNKPPSNPIASRQAVGPFPDQLSPSKLLSRHNEYMRRLDQLRRAVLRQIEDRRRFSFDRFKPAKTFGGTLAKTAMRSAPTKRKMPVGLSFADPKKVVICHRRQTRKEVIFARGSGGGSGKRKRNVKRNNYSNISCKG